MKRAMVKTNRAKKITAICTKGPNIVKRYGREMFQYVAKWILFDRKNLHFDDMRILLLLTKYQSNSKLKLTYTGL